MEDRYSICDYSPYRHPRLLRIAKLLVGRASPHPSPKGRGAQALRLLAVATLSLLFISCSLPIPLTN